MTFRPEGDLAKCDMPCCRKYVDIYGRSLMHIALPHGIGQINKGWFLDVIYGICIQQKSNLILCKENKVGLSWHIFSCKENDNI